MGRISNAILQGIEMVANRKYAANFAFLPPVQLAIGAGYAYDADPNWHFSDDPRANVSAALTDKGIEIAIAHGWLIKCGCCDKLIGQADNERYKGFCPMCRASASQYGCVGDKCAYHALTPQIIEERRRRKDTKWWPEGTVVTK